MFLTVNILGHCWINSITNLVTRLMNMVITLLKTKENLYISPPITNHGLSVSWYDDTVTRCVNPNTAETLAMDKTWVETVNYWVHIGLQYWKNSHIELIYSEKLCTSKFTHFTSHYRFNRIKYYLTIFLNKIYTTSNFSYHSISQVT